MLQVFIVYIYISLDCQYLGKDCYHANFHSVVGVCVVQPSYRWSCTASRADPVGTS